MSLSASLSFCWPRYGLLRRGGDAVLACLLRGHQRVRTLFALLGLGVLGGRRVVVLALLHCGGVLRAVLVLPLGHTGDGAGGQHECEHARGQNSPHFSLVSLD